MADNEARVEQGQTFNDGDFDPLKLDKRRLDPKFHYRFVLDNKDKFAKHKSMGYEIDTEYSKRGDKGGPTIIGDLVLMRMPKDRHALIEKSKEERKRMLSQRIAKTYKDAGKGLPEGTNPTVDDRESRG